MRARAGTATSAVPPTSLLHSLDDPAYPAVKCSSCAYAHHSGASISTEVHLFVRNRPTRTKAYADAADILNRMPGQAPAPATDKSSPCIARQPILTADENVIGYELFYRSSLDERHFSADQENATSATIETLSVMGRGVLCDGRLAFINCTQHALLEDSFALLPPDDIVAEIQETVAPDQATAAACQKLKERGYLIALDNFTPDDKRGPLLEYADFIKADIRRLPQEQIAPFAARYRTEHRRMLAQRVEDRQHFVLAKNQGFTLFQGYFFQQPESMRARKIPANRATHVRLLSAVSKPEIDLTEVENLIKHDPALCYRLLRYLNSPLLGLSSPVLSVRHALTLLGQRESAKWIRMATALVMGQEKSSDLILSSLVRARFCELIGAKAPHGSTDLFLMGMLSLMDAILAVPIGVVIEELSLDAHLKEQLLCAKSGGSTPLSPIYDLMVAQEVGDWGKVSRLAKQLNLSLVFVAEKSTEAMRWAHEITTAARG